MWTGFIPRLIRYPLFPPKAVFQNTTVRGYNSSTVGLFYRGLPSIHSTKLQNYSWLWKGSTPGVSNIAQRLPISEPPNGTIRERSIELDHLGGVTRHADLRRYFLRGLLDPSAAWGVA